MTRLPASLPLEKVEPASFDLPDPKQLGDYRSARLLRDAVRLGFRSTAGPFRSFGRLAFEPRPYQLVPLLMALKLDPVRMLISDDVGIGKTIEAGYRARAARPRRSPSAWRCSARRTWPSNGRLSCATSSTSKPSWCCPPPPRAWNADCGLDETIFDLYPFTVISTEFIKTERRREDFKRTCPELVIVDEAHTCVGQAKGRHLRYELIQRWLPIPSGISCWSRPPRTAARKKPSARC